jgi:flagellar biosynthetic protein FliP
MSVGMVAWMRYRRHGRASTLEMARAMFAPAVAPIPLLLLEHLAMFVLMFVVMLRRRAEYGGAAHG